MLRQAPMEMSSSTPPTISRPEQLHPRLTAMLQRGVTVCPPFQSPLNLHNYRRPPPSVRQTDGATRYQMPPPLRKNVNRVMEAYPIYEMEYMFDKAQVEMEQTDANTKLRIEREVS